MREFKYDVIQLIHAIRERPCIWDKALENYKDRVERRCAWEEIFSMLEAGYDDMTLEDKRLTGEQILNKWTNIRDTFVKSLKTKFGRPKRKYVLYDHLKFLLKVTPDESGVEQSEFIDESNEEMSFLKQEAESQSSDTPETSYAPKKRTRRSDCDDMASNNDSVIEATYIPKKRARQDDFDDLKLPDNSPSEASQKKKSKKFSAERDTSNDKKKSKKEVIENDDDSVYNELDFIEVDESDNPRVMNEDEAFFASLLPTVARYTDEQRLEFRLAILTMMKKIHDNRKWHEEAEKEGFIY